MPRKARVVVPNCPHHVVQRGHNRKVVFVEDRDYQYYLGSLREWKTELGCKVYAYCLMANHVHLIVDPGKDPTRLGRLMKRMAGRQTRLVNKLEGRTGTLWESRYKSSAIESEQYLLTCSRYIELNPVRANRVAAANEYRWSSYQERVGEVRGDLLDQDPCYLGLGRDAQERSERYRLFVEVGESKSDLNLIREALQRGQLTGSQKFVSQIEEKLGVRIEQRKRGRPKGHGR